MSATSLRSAEEDTYRLVKLGAATVLVPPSRRESRLAGAELSGDASAVHSSTCFDDLTICKQP